MYKLILLFEHNFVNPQWFEICRHFSKIYYLLKYINKLIFFLLKMDWMHKIECYVILLQKKKINMYRKVDQFILWCDYTNCMKLELIFLLWFFLVFLDNLPHNPQYVDWENSQNQKGKKAETAGKYNQVVSIFDIIFVTVVPIPRRESGGICRPTSSQKRWKWRK